MMDHPTAEIGQKIIIFPVPQIDQFILHIQITSGNLIEPIHQELDFHHPKILTKEGAG